MNFFKRGKGQTAKHGNQPTVCQQGHSHRSKLEGAVCQLIHYRSKTEGIELVQIEDHIYLTAARIGYVADFKCRYTGTGEFFWIEAKGFENDRWPMKKKLWKFYGPGQLHIYKGTHLKPYLDEVITPVKIGVACEVCKND